MSIELGLQLFSVRESLERDFIGTLEKVSEIGYENLEFFFHDKNNFKEQVNNLEALPLKEELERLGLQAVSAHFNPSFFEPEETLEAFIAYVKTLGITRLAVAIAFFKEKEDVLRLAAQMNKVGEVLKKQGLTLYYHNHFQEFQQFDGVSVFDLLLENTDPALVKVEFDTYWAERGGVTPVSYLEKLGNRCEIIHQKDLPASVVPVNLFEKTGYNTEITMDVMRSVTKKEDFIETGQGKMDIPAIVETFKLIPNADYIFIEQDWTSKDPLESIRISYDYMSKLIK